MRKAVVGHFGRWRRSESLVVRGGIGWDIGEGCEIRAGCVGCCNDGKACLGALEDIVAKRDSINNM